MAPRLLLVFAALALAAAPAAGFGYIAVEDPVTQQINLVYLSAPSETEEVVDLGRVETCNAHWVLAYRGNFVCGCDLDFQNARLTAAGCRKCTVGDLYISITRNNTLPLIYGRDLATVHEDEKLALMLLVFETSMDCELAPLPAFEWLDDLVQGTPAIRNQTVSLATSEACRAVDFDEMVETFEKTLAMPYQHADVAMDSVISEHYAPTMHLFSHYVYVDMVYHFKLPAPDANV